MKFIYLLLSLAAAFLCGICAVFCIWPLQVCTINPAAIVLFFALVGATNMLAIFSEIMLGWCYYAK